MRALILVSILCQIRSGLRALDEPTWVGSCSKLTEVIQTDAIYASRLEMEVASPASTKELSFAAVVDSTDRSSDQRNVYSN